MIQVPDGWELKLSSELCKGIADGTHDTPQPSFFGFNLVTSKNLKDNKLDFEDCYLISEEDYIAINKRSQVKQYDILFGMIGTIGNPVIILNKNIDFAIKNVGLFRFNGDYELAKWFYYYLSSEQFKNYLDFVLAGSSQKFVSLGMLRTLPILIPKEKKEQEKIAKILSTLDNAIESTNRIIEKEKNIKMALMQELLTNGIDKNGQIRTPQTHTYKQSELGFIPDEWEATSIDLLLKNLDSKRIPLKEGDRQEINGQYPYYGASGIIDWVDDYIFDGEYILLGEDGENVVSRVLPLAFKTSGKIWVNNHAHVFQCKKDVNIDYIVNLLENTDYKSIINGSAQPKITQDGLNKLFFKIAPKNEQKQIARILNTQDKKIEKEGKNLSKLKELKKGLMIDLLSGKVRVKVL